MIPPSHTKPRHHAKHHHPSIHPIIALRIKTSTLLYFVEFAIAKRAPINAFLSPQYVHQARRINVPPRTPTQANKPEVVRTNECSISYSDIYHSYTDCCSCLPTPTSIQSPFDVRCFYRIVSYTTARRASPTHISHSQLSLSLPFSSPTPRFVTQVKSALTLSLTR